MPEAAAAARIHAQIQAKKGIQHVDVPPIRTVCPPICASGFDIRALVFCNVLVIALPLCVGLADKYNDIDFGLDVVR
jgi:hypothetical protein